MSHDPSGATATKRDLVALVGARVDTPQNEIADIIQTTLDAITQSLAEGQRIEVRNFGVFEIKTRDARTGRNPRTGQTVPIAAKRVASFRPGKALKELVQGNAHSAGSSHGSGEASGPVAAPADGETEAASEGQQSLF